MRKMLVVAMREYQAAVRTKAFIISIVAMPVFFGGSIIVQGVMRDRVDTSDRTVAVLDLTGALFPTIAQAASKRNETTIYKGEGDQRRKVLPRYLFEEVEADGEDVSQLSLTLSDRVRAKQLFAFVVIGPDIIRPGDDPTRARIAYHSNTPTYDDIFDWIVPVIRSRVQEMRFEALELPRERIQEAMSAVAGSNLGLVSTDEAGQIVDAAESNRLANVLVPLGLMMLMWMIIMVTAQPLMQSTLEEKMQRIAEVLLGSVTPFQLMSGKLLGIIGVSLTMATIYLIGAFIAINRAGFGSFFPAHLIWWFVIFQTLAVVLFGSLFAAIGAAVTDLREAQSLLTPVMLVVVSPLFVWFNVLKEPLSPFSTAVSLFPPATPMLMLLRQAVPPGIPTWQPLLGVVLVFVSAVACVFIAGRIFRVGILMQGQGANFRELIRWTLRG
jgi:ABC-2 type transport system permease protein